jgi:hypothetical protein
MRYATEKLVINLLGMQCFHLVKREMEIVEINAKNIKCKIEIFNNDVLTSYKKICRNGR